MLQWSGKIRVFIIYHITICNDCLMLITLYWSTGREYVNVRPSKAELAHITFSFGSLIMLTQCTQILSPTRKYFCILCPLHPHTNTKQAHPGPVAEALVYTLMRHHQRYPDRVNSKGRTKLITSSKAVAIYRLIPCCTCCSSFHCKVKLWVMLLISKSISSIYFH